jgi:O-antigen ligase
LFLWLIDTIINRPAVQLKLFPGFRIPPLIIFLALLLPSVIFASSPIPAAYKWLKYLELSLFALWVTRHINFKHHFSAITKTLSLSVLFQSVLALAQWFKQASIFGYWFFGEQPYNSATPAIDRITWFNGALKTPPLATFTHPNVLGGFLAVTLPFILYQLLKTKPKQPAFLLYGSSFILGITSLFLTFSLSAWLAFLLIGLPAVLISQTGIWRYDRTLRSPSVKIGLIYSGILLIIISLASQLNFLAPASSFSRRSQLTKIALAMIKNHPFSGIGLNHFTSTMEQYGYVTATTRFFQPVHNIYLLVLAETGLIGLIGFVYLIFSAFKKPKNIFRLGLYTLLFLGLFDHYPLTLQQSSLLLFLFLTL